MTQHNSSGSHGPEKLWNFNFSLLVILNVFSGIGFNMVLPMIPKYTLAIGGTIHFAGIISGIYAISALLSRPLSSVLSDRGNKKYVVILSSVAMSILVFCYGLCQVPSALLVVRFLHGVAFGISCTAINAFALLYVPRSRTGEGVGFLAMSMVIGQALGPYLGAVILDYSTYFWVFTISFILCIVSSAAMLLVPYKHVAPPVSVEGKQKIALKDFFAVELIALGLFGACLSFGNGAVNSYLLIIGDERHIANISLYYTIYAGLAIFTRPMAGKIADRFGLAFTLFPAFLFSASAMALIGLATNLPMILLAGTFQAIGYGFSTPAIQAQCLRLLGPARSGVALGTFFTFIDFGYGIGPIVTGYIAEFFGYGTMFLSVSGMLICAFVLFFFWWNHNKESQMGAM